MGTGANTAAAVAAVRATTPAPTDQTRSLASAGVALITVALATMAVFHLGEKSFWQDEAYTWSTVARDWTDFADVIRSSESQNVLYSVLMFGWARLGDSETWLRLPSTVFAILTVPAIYAAGRALHDQRVGLVAALLFAVNVNAVEYAQEARAYSLVMLLTALSVAGFAVVVRDASNPAWLAWVVPTSLLVYTHPYAFFVAVTEAVSLLVLRPIGAVRRRLVNGLVVVALVAMPYGILLTGQRNRTSPLGLAPAREVASDIWGLFGKARFPLVIVWVVILAFGALMTVRAWPAASPRRRWQLGTTWGLLVVPMAFVGAMASALEVLRPAHVLVALPGLVLVGAVTLTQLRTRTWRIGAVTVVVALSLVGVVRWHTARPKQDWRTATAYVLDRAARRDVIVFHDDFMRTPFEYYARHDRRRDLLTPAFPNGAWETWGIGDEAYAVVGRDVLSRLDRTAERIWVVAAAPGPEERGRTIEGVRDELDAAFAVHQRHVDGNFQAGVRVWRYDPPAAR